MKDKFNKGDKIRYIGPDLVAYENNKIYAIEGYDEQLDCYGVASKLGEIYCLDEEYKKIETR